MGDIDPAEALARYEALQREQDAAMAATPATVQHIRKRAARYGPMSGPRYFRLQRAIESGQVNDPQSQTLCGAPAGRDMSWAETRYAKNRAYVTCAECVRLREADLP